jgi:hypothetical protein
MLSAQPSLFGQKLFNRAELVAIEAVLLEVVWQPILLDTSRIRS